MKTTTTILLSFVILFAIGGCSKGGGFKKTKSGLLYKIITDGKGSLAKKGEFLKVHYTQKVRDSIIGTSTNGLPTYAPVDSIGPVYNPAEIFNKLRKGDSAVIVMIADSLQRKQGQLPPYIKKGDKLTLTLKVIEILPNEGEVRKDQMALMDEKKISEVKDIEKYLAENNIKTEKTDKGVFVVVEKQGDGPKADSGKAVQVKYKGQTFKGVVFDTNQDTTFGHGEPFTFVVGQRGAIEGWDDGIRMFNKGGKGKLYIPSMLAYGPNPPPGAPFKAFENLIFDIEVLDVTEPKPRPQGMPGMRNDPRARNPNGQQPPQRNPQGGQAPKQP